MQHQGLQATLLLQHVPSRLPRGGDEVCAFSAFHRGFFSRSGIEFPQFLEAGLQCLSECLAPRGQGRRAGEWGGLALDETTFFKDQ